MKKNILTIIIALALFMSAGGCGVSDTGSLPAVSAGISVSEPAPVESSEPGHAAASNDPVPVTEPEEEPAQEPADQDIPEETPTVEEPDNRTGDEILADWLVDVCSVQATVETDFSACVVDIRTAANPYDVVWDYGYEYDDIASYDYSSWDYVFDVEYYKNAFPMLAMLYHDDEQLLKLHFTTVGVHEGRQGNSRFNVKAFMEICPDWVREKFGDNYACYYLYYIHGAEADRSADVSGENYPKQMTAIMTAVQKEEFDKINAERERLGIQPLIFDSELAAAANYRAWINADGNWAAHDWAIEHNDEVWDIVHMISGDTLGENTTSRFRSVYNNWYDGYYRSESHYNAMINEKYRFIGNSNVYACDNTLEQYSNWKSDTRLIHFDVFMGTLDTALNSK